ncbi:hypothetical protein TrVE_jg3577 [Triparma verrucosa]|uniref:Aspartate racemase n=1 Tax=Triparma verrucosa TaxID=1606542 RepID=A0A9W7CDF4_9STRA|nr:hypothetical protein TrVE_jg3577 [Triparma verrucosa]
MATTDQHVGIIGGMGPDAGIEFCALLLRKTRAMASASRDQEHLHITLESNPKISNRNDAIERGVGVDEVNAQMEAAAAALTACDFVVLICNTAHYFQPAVMRGLSGTRFLSMIDVCLAKVEAHFTAVGASTPVGIIGGKGCMVGRVYQDALTKKGMEYFVLDEANQDVAMEAIYLVKQGKVEEARVAFKPVLDLMVSEGVKTIILGCTEIPIIIRENFKLPEGVAFFDSCDLLADAVVRVAKNMSTIEEITS